MVGKRENQGAAGSRNEKPYVAIKKHTLDEAAEENVCPLDEIQPLTGSCRIQLLISGNSCCIYSLAQASAISRAAAAFAALVVLVRTVHLFVALLV